MSMHINPIYGLSRGIKQQADLRLARPERFLRPLALGNLQFQFGRMAAHVGVEPAVLINPAHLSGQDAGQTLVLVAEPLAADLVEKAEPAVHPARRDDGSAEPRMERGV